MRRWPVLAAAAAAAVGAAIACSDTNVHILTGQLYDPQAACLGPVSGVDVISGGGNGDICRPECLLASVGDASSVYISNTCPPVSQDYITENEDQARDAADPCVGAFAAYEAGVLCSADGGPSEASSDAAPDGGSDAASDGASDGGTGTGGGDAAADAPTFSDASTD